jgi:hypothetical protein
MWADWRSSDTIQRPISSAPTSLNHTGNVITETLTCREDTWMWQATQHRCSGTFTDNGRTLTAHHEQSEDGEHWAPSMIVTLRRID